MNDAAPSQCPNCGAALGGAFCASCGQKVEPLDQPIGPFLKHAFHEIVDFDGRILKSLRLLLFRPGFLTREYVEGRRARYVSPIRLYLLASIACFAVTTLAPIPGASVTCSSCAPEVRATVEREMGEALTSWTPRAMFVLLPAFAGLVAFATRRSRRTFPQHAMFAVHVHAAWFVALTAAALAGLIPIRGVPLAAVIAAGVYALLYFHVALRRVYPVRFLGGGTFVLVFYGLLVDLAIFAIVIPVAIRP